MKSGPFGQYLVRQSPLQSEAAEDLGEGVDNFQVAILDFSTPKKP
jgi:hypothetical protein